MQGTEPSGVAPGMRRAMLLAIGLYLSTGVVALADAPSGAPVITPIQAGSVLDDVWTQREMALVQRNRSLLPTLEEGAALSYDRAWMDGLVSDRPGGSGERGLVGQEVLVPEQFGYPAFFVASASITTHPDPTGQYEYWTSLLVIVRDDGSAPWRIRLETWAAGPAEADEIKQALFADQTEQYAPSPSWTLTSQQVIDRLSQRFQDYAAQPVKAADLFAVAAPGGGTVACFARDYIQHENPPWWHPAKASTNDPRGIAQGEYQTLTSTFEIQRCTLVSVGNDGTPAVTLLALQGGYISHEETAAPPPPWLLVGLLGCLVCGAVLAAVWSLRPQEQKSTASAPEVVSLRSREWNTAVTASLRILLAALVLVEVERWLLSSGAVITAVIFALLMVTPPLWRLIPPVRTIRFTARILIERPLDEVYAFVGDLRNEPRWHPLVLSVDHIASAGGDHLYRARQRLSADLVLEYETRSTEDRESRVLRYTILGKWFPERAEWRFKSVPEGTLVTVVRRLELGPLRAMAFGVARFRQGLHRITINDLNALRGLLTGQSVPAKAPEIGISQINWQYSLLKQIPGIGQSDIGITVASFLACLLLYGRLTSDWFATGLMLMLLIHELGHYIEGRRAGFRPLPPVFILGGAFVYFPGAKMDPLTHARMALAGGLAGGAATALILCFSAATGSPQLLPWVAAGAGANLFGSLLPFVTYDVESILRVVGRWLPLVGLVAAACAWAVTATLGVDDLVIPVAVVLAFVVLRLRYPGGFSTDGVMTTGARLVLAGSWLVLVAYLSVVFILTVGWLL